MKRVDGIPTGARPEQTFHYGGLPESDVITYSTPPTELSARLLNFITFGRRYSNERRELAEQAYRRLFETSHVVFGYSDREVTNGRLGMTGVAELTPEAKDRRRPSIVIISSD